MGIYNFTGILYILLEYLIYIWLFLDPDFKKNMSDADFWTLDYLSERILEGFVEGSELKEILFYVCDILPVIFLMSVIHTVMLC